MPQTIGNLEALDTKVTAARSLFLRHRQVLIDTICSSLTDPAAAADLMISSAEEFGPEQVDQAWRTDPARFGTLKADRPNLPSLVPLLDASVEAHDQIDMALRARDDALQASAPGKLGHTHILGQVFVVDHAQAELRSVDDPNLRFDIPAASADHALDRESARRRDLDRLNRIGIRAPERER